MYNVSFRQERCKGCGLCISVCPRKIIEYEKVLNVNGYHPAVVKEENKEKCVGCASCARICPDVVITIIKE